MKYLTFKRLIFIAILGLTLLCNSCFKTKSNEFIKVKGTQIIKDGKPYYFVGTNMWYACYLGATTEGQERLVKELDTLKALGISNLRICGGTEQTNLVVSFKRSIQMAPGVYDSSLLKGLDFALAEMGKRGITAVIYLTNYWQWSGGMSQYVAWANNEKVPDPDIDKDWRKFMNYSASFYSNSKANLMLRNHIAKIVNRKNEYTGIEYKNDPTIMAWELANEPRPGPDGSDGEKTSGAFIKWIDETSAYIHSIDRNHLVTTGSEGLMGSIRSEEIYLAAHRSKNIDYINLHMWAKNWGWFDAQNIDKTLDTSIVRAVKYINKHIEMARTLGKPITMEEFGLDRDSSKNVPNTSVSARDKYFKVLLNLVSDSLKNNSPLVGTNIWAWGGFGKPFPIKEVLDNTEAFMGDPLGEAQGLNSIYVSDTSTLRIISEHSKLLQKLTERK